MNRIILKSIKLKNFKGLSGEWKFQPGENTFLGKNGTGKTTLIDAERWVRTGKNSIDQANFDIKQVGVDSSKIEHSVNAAYIIDGDEHVFERSYREKWTKRRGASEAELTGHITKYRLDNDANTRQRDYNDAVNEIFGGETFLLCSQVGYLAGLKWERRRQILTEISGEVDKDALIDDIEGLREIVESGDIEKIAARALEDRKQINKELGELPARVDELHGQLPDELIDVEDATSKKNISQVRLDQANQRIADWKKEQEQGSDIKSINQELRAAIREFENEKSNASAEYNRDQNNLTAARDRLTIVNSLISEKNKELVELRENFRLEGSNSYTLPINTCFFCGEKITCGHCDETNSEAEAKFNRLKAERLKKINEKGRGLSDEVGRLEKEKSALEEEVGRLEKIERPAILDAGSNDKIRELEDKIKEADDVAPPDQPEALTETLKNAQAQFDKYDNLFREAQATVSIQKRIDELQERKSELSKQFNDVEKIIFLYDAYNKKLAEMTEEKISMLFDDVSFKMFEQQINGGVRPCCEITSKDGRPYETALSNGEQIKANLDIIKTMSRYFGIQAPVFIDNAEAVTDLPEIDSQVICLRVSKDHKQLTQV